MAVVREARPPALLSSEQVERRSFKLVPALSTTGKPLFGFFGKCWRILWLVRKLSSAATTGTSQDGGLPEGAGLLLTRAVVRPTVQTKKGEVTPQPCVMKVEDLRTAYELVKSKADGLVVEDLKKSIVSQLMTVDWHAVLVDMHRQQRTSRHKAKRTQLDLRCP